MPGGIRGLCILGRRSEFFAEHSPRKLRVAHPSGLAISRGGSFPEPLNSFFSHESLFPRVQLSLLSPFGLRSFYLLSTRGRGSAWS